MAAFVFLLCSIICGGLIFMHRSKDGIVPDDDVIYDSERQRLVNDNVSQRINN